MPPPSCFLIHLDRRWGESQLQGILPVQANPWTKNRFETPKVMLFMVCGGIKAAPLCPPVVACATVSHSSAPGPNSSEMCCVQPSAWLLTKSILDTAICVQFPMHGVTCRRHPEAGRCPSTALLMFCPSVTLTCRRNGWQSSLVPGAAAASAVMQPTASRLAGWAQDS